MPILGCKMGFKTEDSGGLTTSLILLRSMIMSLSASASDMVWKLRAGRSWWRIVSEEEAADIQRSHHFQRPIDECIDNGFENEEGSKMLLLEAANIFGWALQPLLDVEHKRRGSCIQDSREAAEDSKCSAIKARKIKEEIVFEKAGTDPKSSGRRAWEGRSWS